MTKPKFLIREDGVVFGWHPELEKNPNLQPYDLEAEMAKQAAKDIVKEAPKVDNSRYLNQENREVEEVQFDVENATKEQLIAYCLAYNYEVDKRLSADAIRRRLIAQMKEAE